MAPIAPELPIAPAAPAAPLVPDGDVEVAAPPAPGVELPAAVDEAPLDMPALLPAPVVTVVISTRLFTLPARLTFDALGAVTIVYVSVPPVLPVPADPNV